MVSPANLVFGVLMVLVLGGMAVGGLWFLWSAGRKVANAWRVWRRDPADAGTVPRNEAVKVHGTVSPTGDSVAAPLSGREAVYAEARLERDHRYGGYRTEYETSVGTRFRVSDGTGSVTVLPADATLSIDTGGTTHYRYDSADEAPERVREFVADSDEFDSVPAGRNVRYTEILIEPDDEITVCGRVEDAPDGATVRAGDPFTITTLSDRAFLTTELVGSAGRVLGGLFLLSIPALTLDFVLSWMLGP